MKSCCWPRSLFLLFNINVHEVTSGTGEEEKQLLCDRRKQGLWKCGVNCHRYHLKAQFKEKLSFPLSPHFLRSLEFSVQLISNKKKYLGGLVGQSETWLIHNYPSGRCLGASRIQSVPSLGFLEDIHHQIVTGYIGFWEESTPFYICCIIQ